MKSTPLPERIAIIEFDSSHDECILTQVNALKKRGCWVLLVTNEILRKRNVHLESLVDDWIDIDTRNSDARKGLTGAAIGDALIIRRLMRKLKAKKIDLAVFNTAQGGHVRNACLFALFRKMEFVGIIHTIRKFQGSFTQKVINLKIKKYFVLGEFLIPTYLTQEVSSPQIERSQNQRNKRQVSVFYPIDFPNVPLNFELTEHLHITLIGSVEKRRKDLDGFISLIQQCDSSVRFSFLGTADPAHPDVIEFKEKLSANKCLNRVEFYDNRVDLVTFNQILRKTNAILPLIHPNTPSADEYFRNQIPGAMNVALAYKIPLLLHASFRKIEELNTASIYYEIGAFSGTLKELTLRGENIREAINSNKKYRSEYQYSLYLKLLFEPRLKK